MRETSNCCQRSDDLVRSNRRGVLIAEIYLEDGTRARLRKLARLVFLKLSKKTVTLWWLQLSARSSQSHCSSPKICVVVKTWRLVSHVGSARGKADAHRKSACGNRNTQQRHCEDLLELLPLVKCRLACMTPVLNPL